MRIGHVVLVGAGGIGGRVAEPVLRMLRHHKNGAPSMTIVDGDGFEDKNAERQIGAGGNGGRNKAETLAAMLTEEIGTDVAHVTAENVYLNDSRAGRILAEAIETAKQTDGLPLVIAAVDNDATRRCLLDALVPTDALPGMDPLPPLGDFVFLSPGNELHTAGLQVFGRVGDYTIGTDPRETSLGIQNPKDHIPGGTCHKALPSTPQIVAANMGAAWLTVSALQALLDDAVVWPWVTMNVQTFSSEGRGNPSLVVNPKGAGAEPVKAS